MMLRKVYNDPPNGERVHARRYVDRDPSLWVCGMRAIKYIFSIGTFHRNLFVAPNSTRVIGQNRREKQLLLPAPPARLCERH
jgi:hypothetical protein